MREAVVALILLFIFLLNKQHLTLAFHLAESQVKCPWCRWCCEGGL